MAKDKDTEKNGTTIVMFDADLQRECDHSVEIDDNGEVVLTSLESGRFIKLPATTAPEDLVAYVEAHKEQNIGQITKESMEKRAAEFAAAFRKK